MTQGGSITDRVFGGLVTAGLVNAEQAASVREEAHARGVHAGVVLLEQDIARALDIVPVLEHDMDVPQVDLSSYVPENEALALVSHAIATKHRVLPLFEIEGILTVAIGDPLDVFALDDVAGEVGLEVEPVLADAVSFATALRQYYPPAASGSSSALESEPQGVVQPVEEVFDREPLCDEEIELAGETQPVFVASDMETLDPVADVSNSVRGIEQLAPVAPAGVPAIDLDILAIADARKVAVLVSDILANAVSRGARSIHLLPYKDDFFLVYRIDRTLEKVASAPLSLQSALVDGFKHYVKLDPSGTVGPALGRTHTRIGDRDLVLTLSAVPTIAGQRLVVSLATPNLHPQSLEDLGMLEAEARALQAMVERGRGILLVCAPVAGGASATYYALLAHAASVGKTVYSIEKNVGYEIPAVAQVMIDPGGPSTDVYLAAGLRQDVDVLAVDGLRSVDDVHMAVEAAACGKLVIATFPAAGITEGIRRMLDLGVEPQGLSSALTLGVGQRVVRLNCPNCSMETGGALAARIPGAPPDLVDRAGSGCPNCGNTGFRGTVSLYEVLLFTDPVRAVIGRSASQGDIEQAALTAGMRSFAVAGLARVKSGDVSADELNRVVHFVD